MTKAVWNGKDRRAERRALPRGGLSVSKSIDDVSSPSIDGKGSSVSDLMRSGEKKERDESPC